MKIEIQTEGRKTGGSKTIGGFMGGACWTRYWRVVVDGAECEWVDASQHRNVYARLAAATDGAVDEGRIRSIVSKFTETWRAAERERIETKRNRTTRIKQTIKWTRDEPSQPWLASSGMGLTTHTLTRFVMAGETQ